MAVVRLLAASKLHLRRLWRLLVPSSSSPSPFWPVLRSIGIAVSFGFGVRGFVAAPHSLAALSFARDTLRLRQIVSSWSGFGGRVWTTTCGNRTALFVWFRAAAVASPSAFPSFLWSRLCLRFHLSLGSRRVVFLRFLRRLLPFGVLVGFRSFRPGHLRNRGGCFGRDC